MKKIFVFACLCSILSFAACSSDTSTNSKTPAQVSKKKIIQSGKTDKVKSANPLRKKLEISKKTTGKGNTVNISSKKVNSGIKLGKKTKSSN